MRHVIKLSKWSMLVCAIAAVNPCSATTYDHTLMRIPADEPVHQVGFPPIPDHADLPDAKFVDPTKLNRASQNHGDSGSAPETTSTSRPAVAGKTNPAGYNHLPAGAFAPDKPRHNYQSSNPDAKNAATTNSTSANSQLGPEPSLDARKDQGVTADFPLPVNIKQSTTQDLSLPDDESSGQNSSKKKSNAGSSRAKQMLMTPVQQVSGTGSNLINRVIHF